TARRSRAGHGLRRRADTGADGRAREENAGRPVAAGNAGRGSAGSSAGHAETAAEHAGAARSRRRKIPGTAGPARKKEITASTVSIDQKGTIKCLSSFAWRAPAPRN